VIKMNLTQALTTIILVATNIATILLVKDDLKYRLKLWIAKKRRKPIMEIQYFRSDKTKTKIAANPDTLQKTIKIEEQEYQYQPESLYYNPQNQVQGLVIKEGCAAAINTQEWTPGEIDPRQISVALAIQKQRGREEADQSFENYKKYIYAILGLTAVTALLVFLTMQNTQQIINQLINLAGPIQTLAEKTTGQILTNGGTPP